MSRILAFCFVLAVMGMTKWQILGTTAFEGPGLDMVGYFERSQDADYLTQDYFVNASVEPNPKEIFGQTVIGLAKIFHTDWYSIFFVFKMAMVMLVPVTWFLFLCTVMTHLCQKQNFRWSELWTAFIVVAVACWDPLFPEFLSIRKWFSIAWWFPYLDSVAPHCIAIPVGLWSLIFLMQRDRWLRILGVLILGVCTLLHPAIGFLTLVLLGLLEVCTTKNGLELAKKLIPPFCVFGFASFFIQARFHSPIELPVYEVRAIYIFLGHASHYLPEAFGSVSGHHWTLSFGLTLVGICLAMAPVGDQSRVKTKWVAVAVGSMVLTLALQFLAAHTNLSKSLVFLGPARFFLYGYWLFGISLCLMVRTRQVEPRINKSNKISASVTFLAGLALVFQVRGIEVDTPREKMEKSNHDLVQWLGRTPADAVFLVPFGDLPQVVPFAGRRAVFAGTGFPFTESAFEEYKERESFAFGSFEERTALGGSWVGESMSRAFRSRSTQDVLEMSKKKKIDYVVREKSHLGDFSNFQPQFEDGTFAVYSLFDLQEKKAGGL